MPSSPDTEGWNSFGRANASQKWRRQSAAMGNDMTRALVGAARVQPGMRVLDIACGEVWEYFQDVAVPFASFLQSIPAARRREIDGAVLKAIGRYYDGTSIKFTATVNIAVAVK